MGVVHYFVRVCAMLAAAPARFLFSREKTSLPMSAIHTPVAPPLSAQGGEGDEERG